MFTLNLIDELPEGWQAFVRLETRQRDVVEVRLQAPPEQSIWHVVNVCHAFICPPGAMLGPLRPSSMRVEPICPRWWRIQFKGQLDPLHGCGAWN